MDRRNFSLLAVTGFLGLAAAKSANASKRGSDSEHHSQFKGGIYETSGEGFSIGGLGTYDNGAFETPTDKVNHKAKGLLEFYPDGTGDAILSGISLVEILAVDRIFMELYKARYQFTWTIVDKEISLFLTPGSYEGEFTQGPRANHTYTKDWLNPSAVDQPFLIGSFSPHFNGLLLNCPAAAIMETVLSSGGAWVSSAATSIEGIRKVKV